MLELVAQGYCGLCLLQGVQAEISHLFVRDTSDHVAWCMHGLDGLYAPSEFLFL